MERGGKGWREEGRDGGRREGMEGGRKGGREGEGREKERREEVGRQNLLDFLGGAVGGYLNSCVSEYRRSEV